MLSDNVSQFRFQTMKSLSFYVYIHWGSTHHRQCGDQVGLKDLLVVKLILYIPRMQSFPFFLFLKTGILQCDPGTIREEMQIFRLFCHECQRVFHDRLINNEDKHYFHAILTEMASKYQSLFSCFIFLVESYLVSIKEN